MDVNQKQKLKNLISKSRWNFILVRGVITWGVMTAILFTAIQYYQAGGQFPERTWLYFITFPLGGLAWGHFMWLYFNNKYQSLGSDEL